MKKVIGYITSVFLSVGLVFSLPATGMLAYAAEAYSQEPDGSEETENIFEILIREEKDTDEISYVPLKPDEKIDFGTLAEGYDCETAGQWMVIRNTGEDAFEMHFSFDETTPYFGIVCEQEVVYPGEEAEVLINPVSELSEGDYTAVLQVSADGKAASSNQTVPLSLHVSSTEELENNIESDGETEGVVSRQDENVLASDADDSVTDAVVIADPSDEIKGDNDSQYEAEEEDSTSNYASVSSVSERLNATADGTAANQTLSIQNATVTGVVNKTCTGKEVTQDIVVKLSDKTLDADTDYTVEYTNNIKPGTAKLTITGKGDFTGTITKTFKLSCAVPAISSVSNDTGGINIAWKSVPCAEKYQILKKTGNGNWVKLADTTSLSYKDTDVTVKRKYTYTVRCISSDGKQITSDYNQTGMSVRYYPTPQITSLVGSDDGVVITWNRTEKLMKYRVFRKTAGSDWVKIADTRLVRFTDKTAKPGSKYTYTVRCITSDGKQYISGFSSAGKTINYTITVPQGRITKVSSGVKNYTVTFQAVQNAKGYQVRYSLNPDMSDSVIKTLAANQTSLKVTSASEGIYFVQVRAYKQDEKGNQIYGKWSPAKLAKYVRYQSDISEAELEKIIAGAKTTQSKKAILYAFSRVGYPYSQIYRSSGNYYDCSSLVYYAWKSAGVDLTPGKVGTAADEAQALQNKIVSQSQLVPGSLVFFSGWSNGRYKNITHVVMYVGNGMAVEAANSRIGVVYRPLMFDGRGTLVVCCNPAK